MKTERRRYIRFSLPANAYGALGPGFSKVGKIKNISMAGLAVEYITDEAITLDVFQVDIFLRGEELHLSKIPCQIVYDIDLDVAEHKRRASGALSRRRCGVRFDKLSKNYHLQLEHFIRDHTKK